MSEERPPQVVVCCAIRSRLGKHIIAGCRHFDATMRHQIEQVVGGRFTWRGAEQGFLDQYGTFINTRRSVDNC